MRTSRLEAFSDGVLAIIITIMVLELKVPDEPTFRALGSSASGFLTYLLSFVYVGIFLRANMMPILVVPAQVLHLIASTSPVVGPMSRRADTACTPWTSPPHAGAHTEGPSHRVRVIRSKDGQGFAPTAAGLRQR